jgi:membrane-associated phospholipid phosphatase
LKIWHDLTAAGDSAVLLPLIAWIAAWLIAPAATRRDGGRWILAVAVCGGGVALSKLLFMGWGIGLPGLNYTGFSGHSALSALVWPTTGALLARRGGVALRTTAICAGVALALGIAVSRILLKAHSLSEVLLGCSFGLAIAGWFLLSRPVAQHASPRTITLLAAGALLLVLAFYGRVFPSQYLLKQVALAVSGHAQVFRRPPHLP